jgi:hypothetical protein
MSRHARHGRLARGGRHARRARIVLPAPLSFLAVLFASLAGPGALALDPAPALSKHWGTRSASVRLAAVALVVMATALLLLATMRTSVVLPLARWIWH